MAAAQPTIFVFWGYRCDEVAAVTYISGLRRLGLRVQVVGSAVHGLEGVYGVTIQPDLLLNDALPQAKRALCVILPFDEATLRRFADDDRFRKFFQTARTSGACFVTQDEAEPLLRSLLTSAQTSSSQTSSSKEEIITYTVGDELVALVNQLAFQLLAKVTKRPKK